MGCDPASRAGAVLEIDLAAVVANWRLLGRCAAPAECAAVVKADAYGLGAHRVAPALAAAGCRRFFVATLDEGIALRAVLPACEIAVLNGPCAGTTAEFVAHDLVPVVNDPGQIALWREACAAHGCGAAMLHVDTGMARLGLSLQDFAAQAAALRAVPWRGLLSHLACADEPLHPLNEVQRRHFLAVRAALPGPPASLAASSGIFLGRAFHGDFVRPGAALYGINPQPGSPNPMRPVVRLEGRILQVREVDRGQSVGYGASWTAPAPARLATVAVGYADGWPRSFGPRGSGRLGGVRVPLAGRISMDLMVFDVTAADPALARPGACIVLLDEEYGVDAAAAAAGTIGYEMLTALGRRYHRTYREPTC
jgi:alanine racemase